MSGKRKREEKKRVDNYRIEGFYTYLEQKSGSDEIVKNRKGEAKLISFTRLDDGRLVFTDQLVKDNPEKFQKEAVEFGNKMNGFLAEDSARWIFDELHKGDEYEDLVAKWVKMAEGPEIYPPCFCGEPRRKRTQSYIA